MFVDTDWQKLTDVKVVEPIEAYATGWRHATLYQFRGDTTRVCLFFGGTEYEGLVEPYSLIDGVLRDGDGDEIKLVGSTIRNVNTVDSSVIDTDILNLDDPELNDLENDGGGYLSNSDDDDCNDFLFGEDGDRTIIKT